MGRDGMELARANSASPSAAFFDFTFVSGPLRGTQELARPEMK